MNDPTVSTSPASAGARPPLDFEELSNTAQLLARSLAPAGSSVEPTIYMEPITDETLHSVRRAGHEFSHLFADSTLVELQRNGWLVGGSLTDAGRASLPSA